MVTVRALFNFITDLLNSRRVAFWLLFLMASALVLSTFLPSPTKMSGDEWLRLVEQGGLWYRLALWIATPFLVKSFPFVALSLLLFLSTLFCTVSRVVTWQRNRESEFTTEKAFSFAVERHFDGAPGPVRRHIAEYLADRGWQPLVAETDDSQITIQRGVALGFWGSVVFHGGLLFCFMAPLVTSLTGFTGELTLTEGVTMPLRESVLAAPGEEKGHIPDLPVRFENLRGVYAAGKFKLHFGGDVVVGQKGNEERIPFSVNSAASYGDIQFSLQHFGFSPHVVLKREREVVFDYFANLRHAEEGDWFPLDGEGDSRLFLLFLPDFIQEGRKIGTRSQEPVNPRLALKVLRDGAEIGRAIVAPGETARLGEYLVSFPELRHWAGLSVTRERGIGILIVGFILVTAGLAARFFSNERRLIIEYSEGKNGGIVMQLKGYSRYYPAFLEREVRMIAEKIGNNGPV